MGRFVFPLLAGSIALAGCVGVGGADGYAVRQGPQSLSPATDVATSVAGAFAGQSVSGQCPTGATLVQTPDGRRSCAHSGGVPVAVGATTVFDPSIVGALSSQVQDTGRSAAYSDGEYTVVLRPGL